MDSPGTVPFMGMINSLFDSQHYRIALLRRWIKNKDTTMINVSLIGMANKTPLSLKINGKTTNKMDETTIDLDTAINIAPLLAMVDCR